jgi:7-cyano-7-deazaguanine synthase
MKPKSIILLSGGLDSIVSATIGCQKTEPLFALTFDYGQRAARMEIRAARRICRALKIMHKAVPLPFFKEFKKLRMLKRTKRESPKQYTKLKDVWIPNRNSLFINVAACYAEYYSAEVIITGFNRDEAREFPDNKPQFIAAINHSLMYSTLKKVKVVSYVADYTKKQIFKVGKRYKAPLQYVYSCYLGREKMCGECASCKRLNESFGSTNDKT